MLVVIFRARIKQLDDEYSQTAARMRELALTQFGCLHFEALTEGSQEVALSYWPDAQALQAWRSHPEHVAAQRRGRERWYAHYAVEVAEVQRAYASDADAALAVPAP